MVRVSATPSPPQATLSLGRPIWDVQLSPTLPPPLAFRPPLPPPKPAPPSVLDPTRCPPLTCLQRRSIPRGSFQQAAEVSDSGLYTPLGLMTARWVRQSRRPRAQSCASREHLLCTRYLLAYNAPTAEAHAPGHHAGIQASWHYRPYPPLPCGATSTPDALEDTRT